MRRLLATDFGIWPAFKDLHVLSDAMVNSRSHRAALANYLILYDQIVIPTGNFQILPVLRLILGEDIFSELISRKIIVLARYDQWFGYHGSGEGLSPFSISAPEERDRPHDLGLAYFRSAELAINAAIKSTRPETSGPQVAALNELLISNTLELELSKVAKNLREVTHADINGSPYLRVMLGLGKANFAGKVRGSQKNSITVYNPHLPFAGTKAERSIQAVLRVAFENFVLSLAAATEASEIAGDVDTLSVIRAKGQRRGMTLSQCKAFSKMQQISSVPDIGEAFAIGELSPRRLLDLRDAKKTQELRKWFDSNSTDEQDIVEAYVASLGEKSFVERLPFKSLRFAVTTTLGAFEPISGTALGFIDNFLVSKWGQQKSPKLFMKSAKSLIDGIRRSPQIDAPIQGIGRNSPCHCGSGKKYKKCCSMD